jgi:hypothetical protein
MGQTLILKKVILLIFCLQLFCQTGYSQVDSCKRMELPSNKSKNLQPISSSQKNSQIRIDDPQTKILLRNPYIDSLALQQNAQKVNNLETISTTLSVSVLVFGFLIILLVFILLLKQNKGIGVFTIKLFGLIIIITACLFLIVAGFSKDQISPVIGLFGIIAGYLLGSSEKNNKE